MLVLTRKAGEKIFIGDNICITLLEIRSGGEVRLGVDAPRDVGIYRHEMLTSEKQKELEGKYEPH